MRTSPAAVNGNRICHLAHTQDGEIAIFRASRISIGSDVKRAAESSQARAVHLFACSRFAFPVARLCQGASASLFLRPRTA